jgi:putative lipoic acid-binding regulatory protein
MENGLSDQEGNKSEDFYASLKEKLEATHDFPEDYLYKFIITNEESKLTEIYRAFDDIKYTLTSRDSKNGKYTSISLNAFVLDADQVIKIYKEVGKIPGVIML